MARVFAVLLGLGLGFSSIEADKNDKINKFYYGHLEDGICIIDLAISQFPIGFCLNQYANDDADPPEYQGNEHYYILDDRVTRSSVIVPTLPSDGNCNIRKVDDNIGFLIRCTADEGSPLNYAIMNP